MEQNPEFEKLCFASDQFGNNYTEFKTQTNRIRQIAGTTKELQDKIVEHAKGTKVIIHLRVKSLIEEY